MLSICIPTYNSKIEVLYKSLYNQVKKLDTPVEIIIIDDGSLDAFRLDNRENCTKASYIELPQNVGRSKIRNLFLKYAKYDNFLFLDCDSKIIEKNYVKKYVEAIAKNNSDVLFGGSIYPSDRPSRNYLLRWEYGSKKESKPYKQRVKSGNKAFLTNNFLVKRSVFEKIKFDENLTKYGYEDTLFGHALTENGIKIDQLDNPVLNNEYDTNTEYLSKVSESIDNLYLILNKIENKESFIAHIKLLRTYQSLKKKRLIGLFNFIFKFKKPILKRMLESGYYFNLAIFNTYKLGLLSKKIAENS